MGALNCRGERRRGTSIQQFSSKPTSKKLVKVLNNSGTLSLLLSLITVGKVPPLLTSRIHPIHLTWLLANVHIRRKVFEIE